MNIQTLDVMAQGPIEAYRGDGDDDMLFLMARAFALSCGVRNMTSFYPDIEDARSFINGSMEIMASILSKRRDTINDPVFLPYNDQIYLMEELISANLNLVIDELRSRGSDFRYWPYQNTVEVMETLELLRSKGISIVSALPPIYEIQPNSLISNRSGWGRSASDIDKLSIPEQFGIPYPISCSGEGLDQIVNAYKFVSQKSGSPVAYFKIDSSAGGFGVIKVGSKEDVIREWNNFFSHGMLGQDGLRIVEIQQNLNITGDYSVQYQYGQLITPGNISTQIMKGKEWAGNIFNTNQTKAWFNEAIIILEKVNRALRANGESLDGWGGFDIAEINGNGLVILEHNSRRLTGAIPAAKMGKILGLENSTFAMTKIFGNPQGTVTDAWEYLQKAGLAYDPTSRTGVYPMLWLKQGGYLILAGFDEQDYAHHSERIHTNLRQAGLLAA